MIRRSVAAGLAAALLLAGCGQGLSPLAASKSVRTLAARNASDEAWEAVEKAARDAEDALALKGRLAAVLQNPTDMLMQRSLHIMYDQGMARALANVDLALDEAIGQGQNQRTLEQTPEAPNAQVQQYVQNVANRLTAAIGEKPFKTHVIMDDEENAFNQGGHALMVNYGLMVAARDEAEVAAVLGHEITHGLKRHVLGDIIREQLDRDFVQWVNDAEQITPDDEAFVEGWTMLLTDAQKRDRDYVLGYLAGKVRPEMQKALIFRYNSYFAAQSFGRDAESEADVGGVQAMSAAKYDPTGMVSVFDRWNEYAPSDPRYSDHPTHGDRVGFVRSVIADKKLTGTDRGADRLAAIKPLLASLKKPGTNERAGAGPRKATLGNNPWVRKL